jgi:predicted ATPase/DNA-binding CsgD family transcriptional regulator
VGRRRELSEVRRLLESSRLVTLTGPGGVGKTRLAVQVAGRVQRAFGDGVWLVEVAPVADPELVAGAVAGVLGVADRTPRSALAGLAGYLEDKQLLLVLDNCEHLVEACGRLAERLLSVAAGLRVLTTSREALRVGGEQVMPVPPLSTPDAGSLPRGDLDEFEAVRLFAERAKAVQSTFEITPGNRMAVAELCQRLDGLPLAIELATPWLRVLPIEQILVRLEDRFALPTSGSRVTPQRQRTLRATMDWSYGLCAPAEQAMWARVSEFAGGFDLPAAEAVCAGDGIDPDEVFELIAGLVDKSLLMREPGEGADAARYALLETVRQYGQQQLIASGQAATLRRRHRDYYRSLARQAAADRVSPREVEWLLRLRRELPNLRLAMESGLAEPGAAHSALEIAVAMQDLWYGGGRYREGQRWLTRALALDPRPTAVRAIALGAAGELTLLLGDVPAGERMLAEARTLADRLGDPSVGAFVTLMLGAAMVLVRSPDLAGGLVLTEQGLTAARATGDLRTVSLCLLNAGTMSAFLGDRRAVGFAEQMRMLGESCGAEWTRSWGLIMLALVRWQQGDREEAAAPAREALPVLRLVHDSWGAGACLALLAWAAAASGRHRYAARLLGACETIKRRGGTPLAETGPFVAHHAHCESDALRALGDAAYTAAFNQGVHSTLDEAITHALGDRSPRRPTQSAGELLTRREEQIAALVAEGLTNKDIATRLVISQRTAESHIEHILAKLGFTARAQIAGWVSGRRD